MNFVIEKLLLQEKQAGNNSNIFDDEIIAKAYYFLDFKCKPTKQPKQNSIKYILIHLKKK